MWGVLFVNWFKRKKKSEKEDTPPKMPKPVGEWLEIFNKRKPDILEALNNKVTTGESEFLLVHGFTPLNVKSELSKIITVGGPSIPCVSIVDKKTGEIRLFALKALIDVSY